MSLYLFKKAGFKLLDDEIWDFVSKYSINGLIEDCSLSVTNNEVYSDFSYYPNPIDSYLNINNQSKNESIIIFDINSKSIFESDLVIGNNTFDISGLQSEYTVSRLV